MSYGQLVRSGACGSGTPMSHKPLSYSPNHRA